MRNPHFHCKRSPQAAATSGLKQRSLEDNWPNISDADVIALAQKYHGDGALHLFELREATKARFASGNTDLSGSPVPPWVPPNDLVEVVPEGTNDHVALPLDVVWDYESCEIQKLITVDKGQSYGVHAEILNTHRKAEASKRWPVIGALIVAGLGAIPWFWYFLLRRIAELRLAISGRPPDR